MSKMNILMLGAAYGLLPAVRILLAGHRVTVVCRASEQSSIASDGAQISFLKRDGTPNTTMSAPGTIGTVKDNALCLAGVDVDLSPFDMVFLAMSEPQYASEDVAGLVRRIGASGLPVVSLMNALPPPFLARLNAFDTVQLRPAYTAWSVWQHLDPALISAASPDAQAVRMDPERTNELSVTLASNFKVAPFEQAAHQELLETLSRDVSAYRQDGRPLPVRLLAHNALHVPMAKWPMLMAGNCRCVGPDGSIVSIAEAVGADPEASQRIYDQTLEVVRAAGAGDGDIVPFSHYARAARGLVRPSSFARAIAAGAPNIERVDKIIQLSGRALGQTIPEIDRIVAQVDVLMARPLAASA
ncbi:ketopantoate reductase family protein [Meridianimarinicoccus sp. MJW13]|uniref:ketopantoate reductase family protein n=1 Tax=Meridianimarinicoccus sp. MJW13 TaxID=2720031 RepID=UPI0018672770|nr:hypothetical protein [Fluviibacterium sp. MJW13]